jgi:site-specific DNA recombinase
MTAVVLYARLSQEDRERGESLGIGRQLTDMNARAARDGWDVVGAPYVDDGVSASSLRRKRPAFEQMMADLDNGVRVDTLVCWKLDRLLRRPAEAQRILDLAAAKHFGIVSLNDPGVDLSTPVGQFNFGLAVQLSKLETDTLSLRVKRKAADNAAAGKFNGPGGYGLRHLPGEKPGEGKMVVEPEEQAHVEEAANRILAGEPLHRIVVDWKAHGITTTYGRPWEVSSLKRMLVSPRIVGDRIHRGVVVGTGGFPAMLDRDTWTQLVAVLSVRKPGRGSGTPVSSHFLTGLVRCGLCGQKMTCRLAQRGVYRYTCHKIRGCGKVVVAAKSVEPLIAEAVIQYVDGPAFHEALAKESERPASLAADAAAIAADRASLDALDTALFVERTIDKTRHDRVAAMLTTRIAEAERRVEAASIDGNLGRFTDLDIRAEWERRDVQWRHGVAMALIEKVVINPAPRKGTRFDPSRVDLAWRT